MVNGLKEATFGIRMTQWNLSLASGISQSKTTLIERGCRMLTHEDKKKFAKALGT